MASVVLTPQQITAISQHFCQTQFVNSNSTAICNTNDITSGISSLAMSVSIGAGSVSFSPAFSPPLSNLNSSQQAALICYIIQIAMGVPLVG